MLCLTFSLNLKQIYIYCIKMYVYCIYSLTPWSRVLFQKLTGFHLVKKFPAFYGIQRSITTFTSACHVLIQSQHDPDHTPTIHFLNIHIILQLCLGLPSGLIPSGFPTKTLYSPLLATCPTHLILLDFITQTILGEYRSLSSSLCSFLHYPVTSSFLGPNILLNTLFSNNLSLRSSSNVSDLLSHPYKTSKIIVLYILIFKF